MPETKYIVKFINGGIIAEGMELEYALLLCTAILEKFYNEPTLGVAIIRETKGE